jgi:hypothetical protein
LIGSTRCAFLCLVKIPSKDKKQNMFFEQVWVHFGIPRSIISDRDTIFLSCLLDYTLGKDGHQVEEIYNIPSTRQMGRQK